MIKKTDKLLLILTYQFPNDKSEIFLNAEFAKLTKSFTHCLVVPLNLTKVESKQYPQIPTFTLNSVSHKVVKWITFLFQFLNINIWTEIIKNPLIVTKRKTLTLLFNYYWEAARIFIHLRLIKINPESQIIIYSYWLYGLALGAIQFSRYHLRARVVSRAHRFDVYNDWYPGHYFPDRTYLFQKINYIFFISQNGLDYLKSLYPFIEKKSGLYRLGTQPQPSINPLPEKGIQSFLSVSSPSVVKRLPLIYSVLSQLSKQIPDQKITWTHIGCQVSDVKGLNVRLKPDNFGLEFLGFKSQFELMDILASRPFSFLINLSESEGIPVSMMEAASVGIPLIGTDVGGVSEIINDKTGILIPADANTGDIVKLLLPQLMGSTFDRLAIKTFHQTHFSSQLNYQLFAETLQNL